MACFHIASVTCMECAPQAVDYSVPCINCSDTDCNGVRCMDDDPEDEFLLSVYEDEYRAWIEIPRSDEPIVFHSPRVRFE